MGIATQQSITVALIPLVAASAHAQGYRLNDPLERTPLGSVGTFELSPAGDRALFLADVSIDDGLRDLFVVDVAGGAPALRLIDAAGTLRPTSPRFSADGSRVIFLRDPASTRLWSVNSADGSAAGQISGSFTQFGTVASFLPAPTGNRVVFAADKDTDGVIELYSVPNDHSGSPVKLSGAMTANGDVAEYRVSPDGNWVVYRADQEFDERFDLYSAPIDGSLPPVRLNLTRPSADVQADFAISFDSLGVLYRADQERDGVIELYAVQIEGGSAPMKRNATLPSFASVEQFALSTVDDRLVYLADQATDQAFELFAVRAIAGGAPTRLNDPLPVGGGVQQFQLSPDARTVVYYADQVSDGDFDLYSVRTNGITPPVRIAQIGGLQSFQISSVGERVVFAIPVGFGTTRVLSVPIDGSLPPVELAPNDGVSFLPPVVSADGTVLMLLYSETGLLELHGAPIDGSAPAEILDAPRVSTGGIIEVRATRDGQRAVYLANKDHADAAELFAIATTGGVPRRLSPPLPLSSPRGAVETFAVAADGSRAAYVTQLAPGIGDLHAVGTDGTAHSFHMNDPLGTQTSLGQFATSPDGTRVAFQLLKEGSTKSELYSSPADHSGAAVRLDLDGPAGGLLRGVTSFAFTPDSSAVVYAASQVRSMTFELFVVPSDASAPPVRLSHALSAGEAIDPFQISASGAWVVYAADTATGYELYSVPLDGHQPATRLNAPFVAGGRLGNGGHPYPWLIGPDESRVLYVADQDTDDVAELYVVPIDGSQAPLKLNAPLVNGGDIVPAFLDPAYFVSPDGTHVVYRADQEVDGRNELYVVPITGGPALKLNDNLVGGGNVSRFEISPDSTRVVYMADEETLAREELWSARLDGSVPRVKVSGPIVIGGSVRNTFDSTVPPFRIATNRVVFQANAEHVNDFELWSAPLDGSGPRARLNATLPSAGDVFDYFQLTADGTHVVFAADQLANDVFELFVVPADASAAPRRISGPLVANGDVLLGRGNFQVTAEDLVLYRADQDTDGVPELYATQLAWQRGARRSDAPTDFR